MSDLDTTSYGTWGSRVNVYADGPDAEVDGCVETGPPEWVERMISSGALADCYQAYRQAIEASLPPDVSLCGKEFIGPAHPEPGEFNGYPKTQDGSLDIEAMVEDIDVSAIVEKYDVDNTEQEQE